MERCPNNNIDIGPEGRMSRADIGHSNRRRPRDDAECSVCAVSIALPPPFANLFRAIMMMLVIGGDEPWP